MATVTTNGKTRTVKNLRWLISKARQVKVIHVELNPREVTGCILTAFLTDGATTYTTEFASKRVCWDWLRTRRSLRGVWLRWGGALRIECDQLPDTMIPLSAMTPQGD